MMLATEHRHSETGIVQDWSVQQVRDYIERLPLWRGPTIIEPMIGGLCNTSFKVTDKTGSYVARVGFDIPVHGIYQSSVQAAASAASELDVTPRVVHVEQSLIIAEFATGGDLRPNDLRDSGTLEKVVANLKKLHLGAAKLKPAVTYFWPFQVVRRYTEIGRQKRSRLADKFPELEQICSQLERQVEPFVPALTHGDVVPQNMVFTADRQVKLIDWDYGGFGHPNFDLAGIIINADAPDDLDATVIRHYYGECTKANWKQYQIFKIMVALREYLWGMAQEVTSELPAELVGAAMTSLYSDQKAGYEGYTDLNEGRFNRLWQAAAKNLT
jgi:thiamine kinase-like enzyme